MPIECGDPESATWTSAVPLKLLSLGEQALQIFAAFHISRPMSRTPHLPNLFEAPSFEAAE